MAAGAMVEDAGWLGELQGELRGVLAPVFAQARSRLTAFAYIGALLSERGDRKSCWQLAEEAGHATPRRMQALLAEYAWDWKEALAALQRFITAHLGDDEAIFVLDETAELKKGAATAGVARQHAGITGQVENCQTVVFAAYVTARAHALLDFRLYLPKSWCADQARLEKAHIPDDTAFITKPALGAKMITGAAGTGIPFAWVAADEVLRPQLEAAAGMRGGREGVRARGPGELHGHAAVRAQGDGRRGGGDGAGCGVGDPLVRARLQGPPRLRLGVGRHCLAAALAADPPQPVRPI